MCQTTAKYVTSVKKLHAYRLLHGIQNDDFLQAVTLLATYKRRQDGTKAGLSQQEMPGVSCKRRDILKLPLSDYQAWADGATLGFVKAARLLFGQKIFQSRDLPYRTQLTPLAAIMTMLGDRADNEGVRAKLVRWYWCGVLGELYGGAKTNRMIGGNAPSVYLARLKKSAEVDDPRLDAILHSHLIKPDARGTSRQRSMPCACVPPTRSAPSTRR